MTTSIKKYALENWNNEEVPMVVDGVRKLLRTTFVIGLILSIEIAQGQSSNPWRDAFGEPRASVVESLVQALFPGARPQWGKRFSLLRPGSPPVLLDFPGYVQRPSGTGWEGVAAVELGADKADFLTKAARLESVGPQNFTTEIVVFQADSGFKISNYKRFPLDPAEALTQIVELHIKDWPSGRWPRLSVMYHSYYAEQSVFGLLTWSAQVDANTGTVVGKIPIAISKRAKDGSEQPDYLVTNRLDAATIQIKGEMSGKSVKYSCDDPCVVNGQKLFDQW